MITYHKTEDLSCECGNEPDQDGFFPCNYKGERVEPVGNWDGTFICERCEALHSFM